MPLEIPIDIDVDVNDDIDDMSYWGDDILLVADWYWCKYIDVDWDADVDAGADVDVNAVDVCVGYNITIHQCMSY